MAPDTTATELAGRLREAREWMGYTCDQVVRAAGPGWTGGYLAAIEDGTATPTGAELEFLGRIYRRPLEWFRGESAFQPSPEMLRQAERLTPHDREVMLDFLEWLAGAGKPAAPRRTGAPGA